LVTQWNSVTFTPTTTTLSLTPTSITHGSPVTVAISVSPTSGSGVPTGNVSLMANTNNTNVTVGSFTLSDGTVEQSTNQLPGGVSSVQARYAGDSTHAPSYSTLPVIVNVNPESSTTTVSVLTVNSQGNFVPFTGGPFGSFIYLRADVAGLSGYGTPTGSITFTDTFGAIPGGGVYQLNGGDQPNSGAYTATPNGILNFNTGAHSISASYSGDNSFNSSTTTQSQSFTITPGFFAAVPSNQSQVVISVPGSSGSTSVTVSSSTGFSGTISLSCSGLPSGAACQFSPSSITAAGSANSTASTITVATTAASTAAIMPQSESHPHLTRWLAMGSFLFFSAVLIGAPAWRRTPRLLVTVVALIILAPACGGGGSSNQQTPPPQNPGTPTGAYNVTVTATSGSTASTTGFTLVVQ
jgi:hypothetical protein